MHEKDQSLIDLRPIIDIEYNGDKSPNEIFMHDVLRPILKFQHDKIICLIESTPHFENIQFRINSEENTHLLKHFISKNSHLKMQLIGIVLGLMTRDELEFYLLNSNPILKRIIEMSVVRYISILEN